MKDMNFETDGPDVEQTYELIEDNEVDQKI
jgi:hypothetical protein